MKKLEIPATRSQSSWTSSSGESSPEAAPAPKSGCLICPRSVKGGRRTCGPCRQFISSNKEELQELAGQTCRETPGGDCPPAARPCGPCRAKRCLAAGYPKSPSKQASTSPGHPSSPPRSPQPVSIIITRASTGSSPNSPSRSPQPANPPVKAIITVTSDDDADSEHIVDEGITPDLKHVPLTFTKLPSEESIRKSQQFFELMNKRRTIRQFSSEPVPEEVIQNIVKTAGTAPSGAHTEPWTFVAVTFMEIKEKIREIIEEEEEIKYKKRMGKVATTDLKPSKKNWVKEYLTEAPCLILVFKQMYSLRDDGKKKLHYHNEQSTSIAVGFLLAAIHFAGLFALTSTPLSCGPALSTLLQRPSSEKLIMLLPIGYPAENCTVSDLHRKNLEEILVKF